MKPETKQFYKNAKIRKILFCLFVFFIFFPVRHVFNTPFNFLTGQYSDFTSISVYACDILLFPLAVLAIVKSKFSFIKDWGILALAIWAIFVFLINFKSDTVLNLFTLIKLFEFIVAYGTTLYLFKNSQNLKKTLVILFIALATVQSAIALAQFWHHGSIGLGKIGEQQIGPNVLGAAKIVVNGQNIVRGYGTFPHPNLLAVFILVAILFLANESLKSGSKTRKIVIFLMIFVNILGLAATFSRATWFALIGGLFLFYLSQIYINRLKNNGKTSLFMFFASIFLVLLIFWPYISSRGKFRDTAVADRMLYNKIGLNMIIGHPIFGLNIGNSVVQMPKFSLSELAPWQIQPIHNYLLIICAELGIFAGIFILFILFKRFFGLFMIWRKQKNGAGEYSNFYISLFAILATFMVLMQFDHYFYTTEQTGLLFWIILALITAEIKNPSASDETAEGSKSLNT